MVDATRLQTATNCSDDWLYNQNCALSGSWKRSLIFDSEGVERCGGISCEEQNPLPHQNLLGNRLSGLSGPSSRALCCDFHVPPTHRSLVFQLPFLLKLFRVSTTGFRFPTGFHFILFFQFNCDLPNLFTLSFHNENRVFRGNLSLSLSYYQTLHFLAGFIGEPFGQLKVLAKSTEFETTPFTRYRPGACSSERMIFFRYSRRSTEHQTGLFWKRETKRREALESYIKRPERN